MMLAIYVGAVALLAFSGEAQLFPNSSISAVSSNATAGTILANATLTTPPSLSTGSPFPNRTLNLNSTTNDIKNACQASFDSWTTEWWWWSPTTQLDWTAVETENYVRTLSTSLVYNCTQTCGTICYAGSVSTSSLTSRFSTVRTRTYGMNPPYTVPKPNCTIAFDDCLSIQTVRASEIQAYSAMPLEYQVSEIEPPPPACSACISTSCFFEGLGMSLYYWPATTSVSRDYCATAPVGGPNSIFAPDVNHTFVPTSTGPYDVVDGITMYQGNVYISYVEPQVYDNCGHTIRRKKPGPNIITIASTDLHSLRKYPHALAPGPAPWDLEPWQVNFDDFNPPTPYSAYAGQRECAQEGWDNSECSIVKPDEYYPYMLMPPQIRNLDENWRSCRFDQYAAFDPPIALHTRGSLSTSVNAQPTPVVPAEPNRVPPTPGQSGGDGFPTATSPPPQSQGNDPTPTNPNRPNVPRPVVTIGPSAIPVDPTGGLVIVPGTTLRRGDPPITLGGTRISVGPSGIVMADPRRTTTIPIMDPTLGGDQFISVGRTTVSVDSSGGLVIQPGLTLRNGDRPVTMGGTTLSVGPSGVVVADAKGTTTMPIPTVAPNGDQLITVGQLTLSINPSGEVVIRPGLTLKSGDPAVTVDGTTISIGPGGITIVDSKGTSTIPVSAGLPTTPQQVITVGGKTYTMRNGQLILGPGRTLSVSGSAAVIAGTTISLAWDGVMVADSSSTSKISMVLAKPVVTAETGPAENTLPTGNRRTTTSGAEAVHVIHTRWLWPMVFLALFLV